MAHDAPEEVAPSFVEVRRRLPAPSRVEIRPGLALEVLHIRGEAPPLVFVHGGLGNLWNFYPQFDRFQGHRELVAYSLAGNGRSQDRGTHSLPGHVQDLSDLLATLRIERPVLVGWSYGTILALEYAKTHPVAGLLLAGGGASEPTPQWQLPVFRGVVALRLYRALPGGRVLKEVARRAMLHPATPASTVEDLLRSNPLPRRVSAWRTVAGAFLGHDGAHGLDGITCPVLVVRGAVDNAFPRDTARRTIEAIPGAEFHELDRAGHVIPVERPETFGRLLDSLLARVERA